jgi:Rod binding domain-containing protein
MGGVLNPVLSSGLGASISSGSKDSPQKIRDAASQFEGLLVGEMLKSMHQDGDGGWLGTGEDPTASSAMQLADEYLAQSISKNGGLGLARMIDRQLEAKDSSPATPPSPHRSGTLHTHR